MGLPMYDYIPKVSMKDIKVKTVSWITYNFTSFFFQQSLAHLAQRAKVTYCHSSASGVRCPSTLENKYLNMFSYKTTGPTVLKLHMEHDLTPGSQKNCKIGSGRISKMATVTKNSKNNKINFFPRTTGYFWLNFGMEYQ